MKVKQVKINSHYHQTLTLSGYSIHPKGIQKGYVKNVGVNDTINGRWHIKFCKGVWLHYDRFIKVDNKVWHKLKDKFENITNEVRYIEKQNNYIKQRYGNNQPVVNPEVATNLKELQQLNLNKDRWTEEMYIAYYGMTRQELIKVVYNEVYR